MLLSYTLESLQCKKLAKGLPLDHQFWWRRVRSQELITQMEFDMLKLEVEIQMLERYIERKPTSLELLENFANEER